MQDVIYYIFCAMMLGGGLGVVFARGYVNAAMSMLLSMLGVAGMMLLMKAYLLAFIMVSVYAGAVLVLFVFVVMLIGEDKDGSTIWQKISLLLLWVMLGAMVGYFSPVFLGDTALESSPIAGGAASSLAVAKNYGYALFSEFMLPFQICGALLLVAMVGVIVISKTPFKRDEK